MPLWLCECFCCFLRWVASLLVLFGCQLLCVQRSSHSKASWSKVCKSEPNDRGHRFPEPFVQDAAHHLHNQHFQGRTRWSGGFGRSPRGEHHASLIARTRFALQEGRIGGAGLDVMTPEPLSKDHRLARCPNVVLTPHIGRSVKLFEWFNALQSTSPF